MLNYLWAGIILAGILFGAFNGRMEEITNAALDSSKEAVTLCITMIGVMAFWTGIMEIASKAGIIGMASRKMRPLIRFLFPAYYDKLYRKFSGARLGGYSGGTQGNGGTRKAGGRQEIRESVRTGEGKRRGE